MQAFVINTAVAYIDIIDMRQKLILLHLVANLFCKGSSSLFKIGAGLIQSKRVCTVFLIKSVKGAAPLSNIIPLSHLASVIRL